MIVLAENNGRIDITVKGEWLASFKTWDQAIFYQEFLKNNQLGGDLDRLYNHVSTMYGLRNHEIKGKSKRSNVVEARVVFSNIARNDLEYTYFKIGQYLGRDHSTVIHHKHIYDMWQNMPKYYGKQLAKYDAVLRGWRGEA
jgi:chromosomal replication initiation ATPase DnaA